MHQFEDGTYITLKVIEIPERFNGEHVTSPAVYCRMYGTAGPEMTFPAPDVETAREFLDREFARRFVLHACLTGCSRWSNLIGITPDHHGPHRPAPIQ
jgi:hypothetical protein